ncbi:cell division protein FtsI (penicillin-binding protein 3) [uncultured Gammaproteobacteria bacterium]
MIHYSPGSATPGLAPAGLAPDGPRRPPRTGGVARVSATAALERGRNRLLFVGVGICFAFLIVCVKLTMATVLAHHGEQHQAVIADTTPKVSRADLVDRNGELLATSLPTASLYADPKLVIDPRESARKLAAALPDLEYAEVLEKLSSGKRFVWIRRNLTPRQHQQVHRLGLPGLMFQDEGRRFYPAGSLTAHVVGYTGIDNNGLAGLEQHFNKRLKENSEPLKTSLDLRVQHILRRELQSSMDEFRAIGAAGLIMDVRTAEVLAMTSLPDFDPHDPVTDDSAQAKEVMFNRNTLGVYEMGSTFKIFNSALALEYGVRLGQMFDASSKLHFGRFTISDYHGKYRPLSVAEIFMHSSNIGSVKMVQHVGGAKAQSAFMTKLGFTKPAPIELPESGRPLIPTPWREINAWTAAYGHGISVSPMHVLAATSAIINGGIMHKPTLVKVPEGEILAGERVVSENTAREMRRLFRLVVTDGTAKGAAAPGYVVGGKTGTADKQRGRHYAQNARLSSFVGVFPMHDPKYLVFVMIDEPQASAATHGFATAGWTAAPAVGRVVKQIAPLLGVEPVDEASPQLWRELDIEPLSTHVPPPSLLRSASASSTSGTGHAAAPHAAAPVIAKPVGQGGQVPASMQGRAAVPPAIPATTTPARTLSARTISAPAISTPAISTPVRSTPVPTPAVYRADAR